MGLLKKKVVLMVVLLTWLQGVFGTECPPEMLDRCQCGYMDYEGRKQFLVNCTDTHFTRADILQHLPLETQVLIFRGNNISVLPWNIFGTLQNYSQLRVVDMSDNKIHEIPGKSYHHIPNVQRLILNYNHISIAEDLHHPRIFSNFINLQELHLTAAFDNATETFGTDLHDIFVSSNLTKLIKIHLEQNRIVSLRDRRVFCDLPSLLDIYIGDNLLTGLDFDIDCLKNLRYIDLEGNKIKRLTKSALKALDALPARNQSLMINLSENPFSCECGFDELSDWLKTTKVNAVESYKLRCHRPDGEIPPKHPEEVLCPAEENLHVAIVMEGDPHPATTALLVLLSIALLSLTAFLVYTNRKQIRHKVSPMVETVSRKVYYSSIGNNDDQEIDV